MYSIDSNHCGEESRREGVIVVTVENPRKVRMHLEDLLLRGANRLILDFTRRSLNRTDLFSYQKVAGPHCHLVICLYDPQSIDDLAGARLMESLNAYDSLSDALASFSEPIRPQHQRQMIILTFRPRFP